MSRMPSSSVVWWRVKATTHHVEIRNTPRGSNTYFVVTDQHGNKLVPCWGNQDVKAAQAHLSSLARASALSG
jgi:hypothetical protein